ncbi:octaprenyl diphosphate synthase [Algicola sagamiensis]|uniref:octaprenyl diphosphate synthase n=1 Tax=Algicola sagamiensis TaxID=163869 RepID=UPI00037C35BB|nr:octaprenyl diphosphate synthase [Algicola sagamiensis]
MDFEQIKSLSADDMAAVNQLIASQVQSDVALIQQLGLYIINSGGKRLRPLLCVLAARALGYEGDKHITLAAIIEFIHTATLLHDDVVDESMLRRGQDTANAIFGNQASVLVGDFLYTRSFQMMVSLDEMKIMQILSNATNVIAEGEVLQLMNCNDPETTEAKYMQVIYSKTAKLFEAATQLTAVINQESPEVELAMQDYGRYLGTAFQLVDDVLDYSSEAEEMGKNVGDDLAEGKPTLPLIYAMQRGTEAQKALIYTCIQEGGHRDRLEDVMEALNQTEALEYTMARANEEAEKAIDALSFLPDSDAKQALITLAKLSVNRTH